MNTIADMSLGDQARVVRIEGNDAISTRLMEMGLVPGTELSLIGTAPLGDPLELSLRGYRLSLRQSEAARVQVESASR